MKLNNKNKERFVETKDLEGQSSCKAKEIVMS